MSVFDVDNSNIINGVNLISDKWIKSTSLEDEWVKTIQVDFDCWSWTYASFTFKNDEVCCEHTLRKKKVSSMREIRKFIERQTANIIRAHERRNSK